MTLEHRAFMYDGTDDYLSVTVPYLRSGLDRGEAVVAVAREPGLSALRDVLGEKEIVFVDSAGFYQHPVHTLRDYQTIVKENAPRRVCALAEPVWDGWDERQTLEWIRYESLINVVFGKVDARALCPYDTRTLPSHILAEARRTHPLLLPRPRRRERRVHRPGGVRVRLRPRSARRTPARRRVPPDQRRRPAPPAVVRRRAGAPARPRYQAAQNIVTAVNEVAANALQHGTPPIGLWTWRDGADLVCEVGDHGFWRPGPLTGFIPPDSALQSGFGLWTVRLLVDLMELRAYWDGTFVRVRKRR